MDNTEKFAQFRREYSGEELDISNVNQDPLTQFNHWFTEAAQAGVCEPNAMTVATAGKNGVPSCRVVLLKSCTHDGFVFYTNYNSHKGEDLSFNPQAALLFFWPELIRQVRITGKVVMISPQESDAYFQSRPLRSQISSFLSLQSQVIASRSDLEHRFATMLSQHSGISIDRPAQWGGYRVIPSEYEFWQGRPDRLHDRIQYVKSENSWSIARLSP